MENNSEVSSAKFAVADLNEWDFFAAFTSFFGLRRATEIMGMCLLWQGANIIGLADLPTLSTFVAEATDRGISKSATYRAMADLRRFADFFEPLREGVPLSELIALILSSPASLKREPVLQS